MERTREQHIKVFQDFYRKYRGITFNKFSLQEECIFLSIIFERRQVLMWHANLLTLSSPMFSDTRNILQSNRRETGELPSMKAIALASQSACPKHGIQLCQTQCVHTKKNKANKQTNKSISSLKTASYSLHLTLTNDRIIPTPNPMIWSKNVS